MIAINKNTPTVGVFLFNMRNPAVQQDSSTARGRGDTTPVLSRLFVREE
jgi:hypothetical protein